MIFELAGFAAAAGISAPEQFADRCEILRELLEKVNQEVNLTRITGKADFDLKHAADSLLLPMVFPELTKKPLNIADIGCGAGFPSLILALAFPHWQISAIDSIGKKVNFVRQAAELLQLKNLTAIHGRAGELNRKAEFQRKFDIVTARAVAPSPKIFRETDKFIKPNGMWIFYKTPGQAAEELPELRKIKNIHWEVTGEIALPDDAGTRVFVNGKIKTPCSREGVM